MLKAILPVIRNGYQSVLQVKDPIFIQPTRVSWNTKISQCRIKCANLNSLHQNTFILKRRWPARLHKKNEKPKILRGKHHVYDLVEDLSIKKRPNLEVILTAFVSGIGDRGDIVSLPRTKAYNNLLLPGLAVYKTDENVSKYASIQDEASKQVTHSSAHAQRTVNVLESRMLSVIMNKDHPWVLEPWHIRASLRKAGMHAAEGTIELPKEPITGPDLLKQGKEFIVTVTVNNMEKAKIRCRIHHWSTNPSGRLPYAVDHWLEPAEPLFGTIDEVEK